MPASSSPKYLFHPRYWLAWSGLGILRIIAWLPYPLQYLAGHTLGILLWILPLPQKKIIHTNLQLCFPELSQKSRKKLLFQNYLSIGMAIVEVAMSWWSKDSQLQKLVTIEGLENLTTALEHNQGVILLSPHFTTLELSGRLLSLSTAFHVMYRDQKNAAFDFIMTRARERNYQKAIHRNDIKGLLTSLKANMPVWYAPDQHFGGANNITVPFFGLPAPTNPATSRIAKLSGAPVLPFYQERLQGMQGYRLVIYPAINPFPSEDLAADTAHINKVMEDMIKRIPSQYLWAHRRFKGQPGDTQSPYTQ